MTESKVDEMRQEFETWAKSMGWPVTHRSDGYLDDFAQCAWLGYRAALTAALAQNTQGEAVAYVWQYRVKGHNEWRDAEGPINSEYDKEMWETRRVYLHAERARVPDGWVPRAVAEVAQGDLHMLKKAIEARDPWPELLVRVNDTERDLRTALAAAPSQRAEVK